MKLMLTIMLITFLKAPTFSQMKVGKIIFEERSEIKNEEVLANELRNEIPEISDDLIKMAIEEMKILTHASQYELFRKGNVIYKREFGKDSMSLNYVYEFDMETKDLFLLNSLFNLPDSIGKNTTSFNPEIRTDIVVSYKVQETGKTKNILGFLCNQFLIEENRSIEEGRNFEIWATKDIFPSLPIQGHFYLFENLLAEYTILEAIENSVPKSLDTKYVAIKVVSYIE